MRVETFDQREIGRRGMKTRAIVLTVVVCFIGVAVCFAQNPFMGTWKLNEAKSKLAPGAPKINKVVYETAGIDLRLRQMASTALAIRRIASGQASLTAKIIPSRATPIKIRVHTKEKAFMS
jgi:hypothetical protein